MIEHMVLSFLPPLALHALIALGLWSWARAVAPGLPWRHTRFLPVAAFALVLVGVVVSAIQLGLAHDALMHAHPAEKASLLAERVSLAMNITGVLAPISWGLDLASLVLCLVGTFERRR